MAPYARKHVPAHLKPGRGRPSEYQPEYCGQVIDAMASEGISLSAFAGMIGVAKNTVYDWIKRYSEFSDAVARAQAARQLWLERKLMRSRKGAETQAAIFALRNAAPDDWRDVKYSEHKHSVSVEKLTDDQLHAIASGANPSDVGVIEGEATRLGER